MEVIGEASNKNKAKEMIERESPDVVFLDIRMPSGAEGFELLDEIEKKDFLVVFVTAFKDYAIFLSPIFSSSMVDLMKQIFSYDLIKLRSCRIH